MKINRLPQVFASASVTRPQEMNHRISADVDAEDLDGEGGGGCWEVGGVGRERKETERGRGRSGTEAKLALQLPFGASSSALCHSQV